MVEFEKWDKKSLHVVPNFAARCAICIDIFQINSCFQKWKLFFLYPVLVFCSASCGETSCKTITLTQSFKKMHVAPLATKFGTVCRTIFCLIFQLLPQLKIYYHICDTPCIVAPLSLSLLTTQKLHDPAAGWLYRIIGDYIWWLYNIIDLKNVNYIIFLIGRNLNWLNYTYMNFHLTKIFF